MCISFKLAKEEEIILSKNIKVKDKELKVFSEVPQLNEKQIKRTVEKQVRFLKAIYPWLENLEEYNDGAMELRPIKRDIVNLKKDFKKSYNAWHMGDKDIKELEDFMMNITGKGYCIYYSAYAFDYHLDCENEDGKKFKKGTVNKQNSLFTTILAIDFDGMSYEEFEKIEPLQNAVDTLIHINALIYLALVVLTIVWISMRQKAPSIKTNNIDLI